MDFLAEIEKLLDMTLADKAEVMRELTAHFDELRDEFVASGMDAAQAQAEAEAHMGTAADIAARLNAAHYTASWKSALLCVVPFAASAAFLAASALGLASRLQLALMIAIGAVMLSVSTYVLVRRRRPIWLATWLAAGMACVPGVLYALSGPVPQFFSHFVDLRAPAWATLLLAAAVLAFAFGTGKFLKASAIASGVAVVCASAVLLTGKEIPGMIMVLAAYVLLVLLAKLIFQVHTYSNALQAILFLFGGFVLRFEVPASAPEAWAKAGGVVLSAVAVVWFARTPRRGTKGLACYLALFAWALAGQYPATLLSDLSKFPPAVLSAAVSAGIYYLLVLQPMYPVIRREVDQIRPTAVR